MKTLKAIQKQSTDLTKNLFEFNAAMPSGFFITPDIDGGLLVTCEASGCQSVISNDLLNKKSLTLEDIRKMFSVDEF